MMMAPQIEKRKKGRPSKADLARRAAAAAEDGDVRRSSRCRNVSYEEDYEDEEEEEQRRKEKKLKVLRRGGEVASRRVVHVPPGSDDDDVELEIEGCDEGELMGERLGGQYSSAKANSVRERKAGSNDADSVPGTPPDLPMRIPLPDKKMLELVLDKLQKKDTYGVFSEPVDPDELPDYHDVIEHPMDFATVRKKLAKGSYSTLEKFESDVLLICSNAMQYNAPDTVYHKQAFSIQELAMRKFQRLRSGPEQYEKELQSEEKPATNSWGSNKQIKKPITKIAPEPVASDLSSGATLANLGDSQPGTTNKASGFERLNNIDESVDGTATQSDINLDKAEDLPSGKGHISRFGGRKALVHDDNRRATYNISTEPVSQTESTFSTFDGEIKQLVAVGLHGDHSYARSLARFAAMLGPVAWNVASKRIEQSIPPGFKFGRGWVGDYEPISSPVLVMQKCSKKEIIISKELSDTKKDEKLFTAAESMHKNPTIEFTPEGKSTTKSAILNTTLSSRNYSAPSKPHPFRGEILDVKPNISKTVNYRVQSPRAKNVLLEKKVKKRVQLNSPPSPVAQSPREFSSQKKIPNGSNIPASNSTENNSVSVPLKQPQNNGFVEVTNRKSPNSNFNIHRTSTPDNNDRSHTNMPANFYPQGHDQVLTDPVQLMRRLTENTQKQQNITNYTTMEPSRKEDPSNASSAAARAWMSIGAGNPKSVSENTLVNNKNQIFVNSLHSPTQVSRFRNDFPIPGMQFYPMNNMNNNLPIQGFIAPQFPTGNEGQFLQNRPFPQLVTNDLSRFQMQSSPRQGQLIQRQLSQKQEIPTFPPDLNLVFQSSGSPGRQSSGLQVDSQQPDLALQL